MSRRAFFIGLGIGVLAAAVAGEVRLLDTPAAEKSSSYALNAGPEGTIVLSWVERSGERGHALRYAELRGDEWGPARTIATGEGWFVNWIDHPAVVVLGGDRRAAHWLVHDEDREGDYGYGIRLVFSDDRGATWRQVFEESGEGVDGYAGFVAYAGVGGGFEVAYLSTVGDGAAGHGEVEPRMALRSARFDLEGALKSDREVDADVCSCCTTAMAVTPDNVFLAFRDRREGEFRDISFARLEDGRWTGSELVHRDGWHIRGCPTNGPALASGQEGPAVAWFTAAGGEAKVVAAFWNTKEQRFDAPLRLDDGSRAAGPASRCWETAVLRSVGSNAWKAARNYGSVVSPGTATRALHSPWRQRRPAGAPSASPSSSAPATA